MSRTHVEDSYPLSPMAEGMLFHTLYAPRAGVDIEQMVCVFREPIDAARLRAAWDHVVAARAVLRAAFRWQGLDEPAQDVWASVEVPWEERDLRDLAEPDQEARLRAFLAGDRRRGFDLDRAPLIRLALFRTGDAVYQLVWTFHHIILDGRSFPLVIQDVFAAYDALGEGRAPELPERRPYRDFIAWLKARDASASAGFWRELLAGFRAPTPLLGGKGEVRSVEEIAYGERTLRLSPEDTAAISAFGREHQLSLNTLLQGAWALLLGRYAGEDDVVFGATRAGRRTALDGQGTDSMLGVFINTLPVRVPIPKDALVLSWLADIKARGRALRDHEHTPLVKLREQTELPKDAPLFETLFVYEERVLDDVLRAQGGAWEARHFKILRQTTFPLALIAYGGDALALEVEYDRRRFDDPAAERMLAHLATMLRAFASGSAARVGDVPMLPEEERDRVVRGWNDTAFAHPTDRLIHEVFADQAAATPGAIALRVEGREVTYAELDARANQLAHWLRARGVGPDTLVGVLCERGVEMVVALYGVLKAGGAYLPLDPDYPRERLAFMLDDAKPKVILTQDHLAARLPDATILRLDSGWGEVADLPRSAPPRGDLGLDHLAYVIYTSGSTGKPKGAMNAHRGVLNRVLWMERAYGLTAEDRVLQKTPYSFDVSVWEFFWPLMFGARLVIAKPEGHRDPAYLSALIQAEGVTTLHFVPSMLAAFLDEPGVDRCASIRRVVASGEALAPALADRFFARLPHAALENLYGPTECAVDVTAWSCKPGAPVVPIGRPIDNTQIYILDDRLAPAPIGVPGELYIAGVQVGRGYLARPELTADRFVRDPFGGEGARMYRSGDVARWLPDGSIEYLGRADFQVKIRGLRIELGEIEDALGRLPSVRQAVVTAREDAPGQRRLVAYVVMDAGPAAADTLRASLRASLPEYMVPAAFVTLPALPLTASGKVDRKALPAPEAGAAVTARVAPRGPVEEALAGIYADVLKLDAQAVGAHDGFFDLGGHSLLAAQVVTRARAAFGVDLAVRALFDAPTVAALAVVVEAALRAAPAEALPPLEHGAGKPALSFAQERLWVLDQLEPGDPAYVIFRAARLSGALDRGALGRALTEIVRRHEVLRTTIGGAGGAPVITQRPADEVPVPAEAIAEDDLAAALRAEAARPFDLAEGPLLRARLFELGGDDHVLSISMHHIVSDAWTLGILEAELRALYDAFTRGQPSPLPELPIQYGDYARWQRRALSGAALDRALAYWKARLAGAPQALDLPSDRRRPPVESHRGARASIALPPAVTAALKGLCRREGATLFMGLLAAFEVLIHRYTGQDDLLLGTPVANRAHAATEKLCGLFLNTLVLRAEVDPDLAFRDLLRRVREDALAAYAHQDLPFERLVQEISPERDRSRSPLFQVMFTLQNASSGALSLPGLASFPVDAEIETSKFDLTLILTDRRDQVDGFFEYATDLFDAATIERMAAHYVTLLAAAVAAPDTTPVGDLALLPEGEREQVVAGWNDTALAHPTDLLIHEIFAEQAAAAPRATALRVEGRDVSYAHLDARANQLARALKKRGVGPDTLVGVFCERGVEMVVALYGVLKAGGAYVPLDPEYPKDRLGFMLDDARPRVILTQHRLAPLLPAHGAELIRLDTDWVAIATEPTSAPPRGDLGLDHLAYVIYTSGSTGKPKGAMNAHRGVLNRVLWMQRAYDLTPEDRVLQKTPYSFDVSVWEFFWPLMFGARLVVAKPEGHRDPSYLASLIEAEGVTTLHFVPSMLAAFLDELSHGRRARAEVCRSVRQVMCSGEALPPALADRFFARLPQAALHNLYGPTECAVDVTAWSCKPGAPIVPIGRPIDNTRIYILDERLAPAPIGVPGELYIAGVQVGRGYLNRAELTEERFLADPFAGDERARMYKSGDVARWLPDGSIEYLGRADFQVKIRGFRIELGEIEAALLGRAGVREAVVLAREDQPGQKRLVAYLVCAEGEAPSAGDLRASLKDTLPEYMIPAAFVLLPALPLTASGKVNRRALPAPEEGDRAASTAEYAVPATSAERALAEIWAAVLRLPRVGVDDNFFEIGGDSILGIQIIARAQQAGLSLTPRQIFQHQTIAELALAAGAVIAAQAEQGPVVGEAPLTPIASWWLSMDPPQAHHFNQASLLAAAEPLDAGALRAAAEALIDHHDALRVRLDRKEGGFTQRFAEPGGEPPFTHAHLAHLDDDAQRAAIEAAAAEAQASLDLANGPAMRAVLFELGEGRGQRLLLVIHHLAVDGVSWRILFEDLWAAYDNLRRGRPAGLRAKTTSFQRWAELLEERARSPEVLREAAYWTADARARGARLPVDRAAGADTEASARRLTVELSAEETAALLREVPEAYGTQINDVLLTALSDAVSAWTGSPDVLIDLEGHGREDIAAEADVTRTVGWFTALFPVALRHDASAGPGERLRSIKEQLRAVPGRGLGYGLLRYLGPAEVAAKLAGMPGAEIIFNYHGQVDQALPEGSPFRIAPEASGPAQSPEAPRPHMIEVIGRVTAGRLSVRFTYSEARHDRATIAALAEGFITSLRALVLHASSKDAGGYTPSDFRRARLSQAVIDALAEKALLDAAGDVPRRKNLEDVYPLSPLQQGILFHTLASTRPETYVVQLAWEIEGRLDTVAFARAWQAVVDRHAILRSAVAYDKLEEPLQVVRRSACLPFTEVDLRDAPAAEQEARAERVIEDDRRRGFDVTAAPLLRVTLVRLRDDAYRFVWAMHHLVLDGWSLPIIAREVLTCYEAFTAGRELRLPAPRPYAEYIDWLGSRDRAADLDFWRAQVGSVSAPTPLGVDHPAGTGEEERSGEARLALSDEDSAEIAAFARRRRLTLSTLVQGAWALLLSRYSREEDVVFGATVSGRSAPLSGVDGMVGIFINTIPVRVAVDGGAEVSAWLSALQDRQVELRDHEHSPLHEVQGLSAVPRGTPLFESIVVVENYPLDDTLTRGHAGIRVTGTRSFEAPAYPLTVIAVSRRALTLRVGYDARRFDAPAVARLVNHLGNLLRGMARAPSARLDAILMLDDAERDAVLRAPNPEARFPVRGTVAERFEAQADRTPGAIAVTFEDESIRYADLDARANQLAHLLRLHGVGPGALVGLCVGRSAAVITGILGILKAGGAYLPLDPDYPKDRLAFMMADARAKVLVTEEALAGVVPAGDAVVIRVDADRAEIEAQPAHRLARRATPDDLAYVIYTSGSTGKPKGAMVTHANVVRLFDATQGWYRFDADDVWTMFHSYAFDFSVWEIWGALLYGGRVVIVPYWVSRAPDVFYKLLGDEGVTVLNQTPSAFRQLTRADAEAAPEAREKLRLRYVIFGGEALDLSDLRPWWDHHDDKRTRLINMYGITETTVHVTFRPVSRADLTRPRSSVIGWPIPDLAVYLLDGARQPVPVGVVGEIYVGGAGVARGYLDRPELTAERFLDDPFRPDGRMYKSGDLARRLENGDLEYLGRADFQVKIRGFRVELGEIEAALADLPGVQKAVALVREDAPGDKRLVAYLVADAAPDAAELRASLKQRLPDHMVPAAFVTLPALPLTENGKVDRKALPAPAAAVAEERAFVAPRGPVEEAVASVFAEVLKVDRVGAHDGFFDLGGHSLLATQAVTRLRAALSVSIPLRALFEAPTPAELSAIIEGELRAAPAEEAPPPLTRVPRDAELVPSFGQERLWVLYQLAPEDTSYVVTIVLRFTGSLDVAALRRALRDLCRRHEVLRTTLTSVEGRPAQVIHPDVDVPMPVTSLAHLPEAEREAAIQEEARAESARAFDLTQGPLLRAHLVSLGPEESVLFIGLHHVVFDAWSRAVLNRELGALYVAARDGMPPALPELPIQYADYAAWERRSLAGERMSRQLAYWKDRLAGAPAALDLPADRPRPPVRSSRGSSLRFSLGDELTVALKDLARREGATLYMTLLSAYVALLHRYTGQDDVVVGSPVAGRSRAETEGLIGFFLNTLVIRARLGGVGSFRDLIRAVRDECLGAFAHQDMPFERLVQELPIDPDPSRSPVFQVIFNLQNTPLEAMDLPGLKVAQVNTQSTTVKVDLTLIMNERQGCLGGLIEYSTDLFDASTIERFTSHFRTLLEGAVADPGRSLAALPLMGEDERRRLIHGWNDTALPFPAGETAASMFLAAAARTPDAIAVVAGEARLTFRELSARANRLARYLRGLGVGADSVVGLAMDRSAELVVGMLGILIAGGAYVPLDPAYPEARLAQIIAEAGASVVVTRDSIAPVIPRDGVRRVRLDGDAIAIDTESGAPLDPAARPDNLAYVLFTSGSTGKPKGVAIEHRNLVNYVRGVATKLDLPEDASYAHVSTFSADLGNTVLFPPLCLGGTLHVLGDDLTKDPDGVAAYFRAHAVDCLKIVPSHLGALLSAARPEDVLPRKLLVLGGEASSWDLVDRIERLAPGTRIMNHYGPTETTVGVLTYPVVKDHRAPTGIVPLGRPLPNSRVYVLDANLNPAPAGVPGEVYIAGAGVARGYLGRPDLTAERFLRDPFVPDPAARMYKTGDRARHLPDGALVFLGRVDHQVKIRGFRIELGEIEAAIAGHAGVREAVVLVHEEAGDKRLVGYMVPRPAEGPTIAELRQYLAERLPEYMVPATIVILDALPLNANGKIDRQALAAMVVDQPADAYAGPRTPVEEVLAGIWADVFERERVGIHERFADLGGHSLLAIQIIARARDAFQAEVPLRAIFESPTIAGLAERVEAALREDEGAAAPPVTMVPRDKPLPLSFSQERLWFLDQLEPGSAAYNVPMGLRLSGKLDAAALEGALRELTRRHEVLRTTFATRDGQPVQVVHAEATLRLSIDDLGSLPADQREAVARREAEVEARRPFDLAKGPLVRARLLRLDDEDHVLLFTMHHIVSDAWTRGILNQEIAALYEAHRAGRPHALPDLPVQYADYAAWQRGYLSGPVLERLLGYWKKQLAGAPAGIELPADRPRPPVPSGRGGRRHVDLPLPLARSIEALARRENATTFMTLLAAFYALLQRYTGQDDLSVGTPVANRTRPETEGLLGFFVNTLVLRVELSDDLTFRDLLGRVRDACLAGYAHQEMPFEKLVNEIAPERDLSRTPLFQVMFTYQGEPSESLSLPGLSMRSWSAESGTAKFDLLLAMIQRPKALHALVEYATDLFDGSTMERLLGHLSVLLEGVAADPDKPLRDLPILPESERHQLLAAWNPTQADFPKGRTLHGWFEAQVDRTPDSLAATFDGDSLTYRELDLRANRVAHHLRKLGVGPETLVGLCTERSMDMLVGLIGILKAGGAYLPLDPEYPKDRLAFMVEDAKAKVILTQARVASVLPDHGAAVVRLDADWGRIAEEPEGRLTEIAQPDGLAYVIYTSGSTGKPKGAMVTHHNVARLFEATDHWYGFNAADVWTMFHSYAFDFSVWEIWGALLYGGRVVIVPYWVSRNPEAFHALLGAERVTVLNQTPSAFRQLIRADEAAAPEASEKLRLRYVIFGGEALDLGDLRPWWARHDDKSPQLVNMYGITETTVHVTYRPVGVADLDRPWSSVIGRPIPDLQVYVLDRARRLAPIGVPGEMYVGGAGVSRGYLARPDLTADRFLEDPFREEPGARLYKTGDLARYLPSGDIEYLGRADHQVKIRGFRIELGEIEAALDALPAVREAVVLAREDGPGDKRLVAYLVCREGHAPSAADLRAALKQSLPDMMVPAAFVLLDALPLTENGKVDRRALPAPEEGERARAGAAYVAPSTRAEEELSKIWAAVLRLPEVGVHDNFFELGGDSIVSIQIVARARDAGLQLSPRDFFLHQTIAELAQVAKAAEEVTIDQGPVTGPVVITPVQRWWLDQDAAEPHHHNQAQLLEVRGPLDGEALAAAVDAIVDHHDMLRVRLTREGGQAVQFIAAPGGAPPVSRIDVSRLAAAEQTETIEREAAAAQASLDLALGPILRVVHFDLGPEANARLLLIAHHLAVDVVSWGILLDALWRAYEAAARGEPITLPAKSTSFQRWAEALAAHARSEAMREEEAYWLESARGGGRLPFDRRGENLEGAARAVIAELPEAETKQLLHDTSRAYKTQVLDLLLTAFAQAMAPWIGSDRVRVDMEGHGRESEVLGGLDISRTAGWFTAIYPVVIALDAGAGPGAQIMAVKEQLRRVPNHGVGYGLLRYMREGEAIAARLAAEPRAEVSFNYLGQVNSNLPASSPFSFARESLGPGYSPRARRAYALDVQVSVRDGRLRVRIVHADGHDAATIEALSDRFLTALCALIAHCLSPEAGGHTPSDFRHADVSQDDIDDMVGQLPDDE